MKESRSVVKIGMNVGFISLLMIFMVLCLTVFVVLSLTSAAADKSLTDRTGDTAIAYYSAQNRFQSFLSDLDLFLWEWGQSDDLLNEHLEMWLHNPLAHRETVYDAATYNAVAYDAATRRVTAQWPAGERMVVKTEIQINPPGDGARYRVLSFIAVPVRENINVPLNNLWNGDDFFHDH